MVTHARGKLVAYADTTEWSSTGTHSAGRIRADTVWEAAGRDHDRTGFSSWASGWKLLWRWCEGLASAQNFGSDESTSTNAGMGMSAEAG